MTEIYAFSGDTIDPKDDRTPPTVTLATDPDGQNVLAYLEPDVAAQLGLSLIYASLRQLARDGHGDFNVDNIERRTALVAKGYGIGFAANLPAVNLSRYGA